MNCIILGKCRWASLIVARAALLLPLAITAGSADHADAKGPAKVYVFVDSTATDPGDIATFGVRLSKATSRRVTVDYTTFDWEATVADGDYLPEWGTLTFAPGETYKTVTVQTLPDEFPEFWEDFGLWAAIVNRDGSIGYSNRGSCTIFGELGAPWWYPPPVEEYPPVNP